MNDASSPLVSVSQAQRIVLDHVAPLPIVSVGLDSALGLTLASDIACDIDMPPFDRAMMDGFAVRSADTGESGATLTVIDHIAAGGSAQKELSTGEAARINTGAPMPSGADAVIKIEDTKWTADGGAVELQTAIAAGKNVCERAEYLKSGTVVLETGTRLGPSQIAIAAASGAARIDVYRRPVFAVLATGNELIEAGVAPQGAQIRNSNSPMLSAFLSDDGVDVVSLGIAADDRASLTESIKYGLQCDGLCITGGVSMGAYDFVPEVLDACGVQVRFHKMSCKPGKPSLFGTGPEGACVFGLPGNPVSAMLGYWLLVRPAFAAMQGRGGELPKSLVAKLDGKQAAVGDRDSYWPAKVESDEGGLLVASALSWKGSGDPFGMGRANGWIIRHSGSPAVGSGDSVEVILLSRL
ncbi:MAG: molybdopterin molybdotransferase MoeA [Planctomycetes bacterium]|nr:molybdopterin molybdotransferase MoeA [Planctomycetota bacterium]